MDELDEDLDAIKNILNAHKRSGVENPLLPMDVDIDGDGIVDAFGLDELGNVVFVSGVSLDDTVFVSEGGED